MIDRYKKFQKIITEELEVVEDKMLTGTVSDMEMYKYLLGMRIGLTKIQDEINKINNED